ncbi:type VI secretion system Vgr family protein [Paraburkholderia sp. BL18I3N2]|uniref:type VI secretion system Vgr family protein n=1 Tax=Paraburkholderia sp. BL18I3N2 TaxID=1938799 RepID=UPI000D04DF3D
MSSTAIVTYIDGDPDRPLITGRVYNSASSPQWHTQGQLSGYKSKEHKGSGYNQLVLDDSTGQNRAQLYSTQTAAQLNLGYPPQAGTPSSATSKQTPGHAGRLPSKIHRIFSLSVTVIFHLLGTVFTFCGRRAPQLMRRRIQKIKDLRRPAPQMSCRV